MASQHWYTLKGDPLHTVIGKNGKERSTTLRDARQLNLLPSVTTIMSIQDKPALTMWLNNELLDAAINNPYNPFDWSVDRWKKHMIRNMRNKTEIAASRGTEIHNALEQYFISGNICTKDVDYITPAIELIHNTFPNEKWIAEATFANKQVGYAGCVDLHSDNIIIDFKTKDKTNTKDMKQYNDHKMQLAAYQGGLGKNIKRRFNLFISINPNTPGLCKLVECTEFSRYWNMFNLLVKFWQEKNKYKVGE
jgi:hypothetical protein